MKNIYKSFVFVFLLATFVLAARIEAKIERLEKRYIDRLEPLIKDSLKMHQWFHNWEATYDEKTAVRRKKLND